MNSTTRLQPINSKIFFIGAGPGDAGLITVKGASILSQAEVIITDRLAGDEIIKRYANADAIIIDVGKQGGNKKSYRQQDINKLLVQFAQLYEKVVRLKGGDIAIFSNVFDELKTLTENKIDYEIVPGITAASGASAYTAVPLTARGYASGARFVTFYKNTAIKNESWKHLALFEETLVFYMSSTNLLSIVKQLFSAGADRNIPFIVVEQATTPHQNVQSFTLKSYFDNPVQNFKSPSLVIMGNVAALYKDFAWFKNEKVPDENFFRSIKEESNYLKIKSFISKKSGHAKRTNVSII